MNLEEIERHVQMQVETLDEASVHPDRIIGFDRYKEVYDTLIALRQAQALEGINEKLEDIMQRFSSIEDSLDHMRSWLHAIADK